MVFSHTQLISSTSRARSKEKERKKGGWKIDESQAGRITPSWFKQRANIKSALQCLC